MEIVKLNIDQLEPNAGQIDGLPVNPRQWTRTDIDSLAKSLRDTPELFEARPIIVVPHGGKYVILGGNLRYEASRANKATTVPCVVFPESTPVDKMKEIVIKDNGAFGQWDYDALANEWDDLPLVDWGVPSWKEEKLPEENASTAATELGENGEDNKMNLSFSPEDYARVLEALLAFGGSSLEECLMLALGLNE